MGLSSHTHIYIDTYHAGHPLMQQAITVPMTGIRCNGAVMIHPKIYNIIIGYTASWQGNNNNPSSNTCASTNIKPSNTLEDMPRQQRITPLTSTRCSNIRSMPSALSVASNKISWKVATMIAKKRISRMADSNKTKITETIHASQLGQLASISACAWSGKR